MHRYILVFLVSCCWVLRVDSVGVIELAAVAFGSGFVITITTFCNNKEFAFRTIFGALGPTLIFFAFALLIQNDRVQTLVDRQLSVAEDRGVFWLEGRVAGLPERDGELLRFQVSLEQLQSFHEGRFLRQKGIVRLSWRTDKNVRVGELWRFKVRLKRPRGFVNPKGFDYQAWLLGKGIVATGYVYSNEAVLLENTVTQPYLFAKLREKVSLRLNLLFSDRLKHPELLRALLIGDKSGIQNVQWECFRNTGTIHLMAISGLHVGLISAFATLLANLVLRPLVLIIRPIYYRVCVALISISAAFFYAQLAGFSLPTQRAFYCVVLVNLILLLERRTPFLPLLGFIACAALFLNPFVLMQSGFVLSFSAVAALLLAFSRKKNQQQDRGKGQFLTQFVYAQLVVFVGLFPVMALLQLPSPLVAPVANMVAIPLLSFLILPLAFIALAVSCFSISLSMSLFECLGYVLSGLMHFLEIVESWNPTINWHQNLHYLALIALFLVAIVVLAPIRKTFRAIALVIFSGLLLDSQFRTVQLHNSITILDVGQGLASVVKGDKGTLVFDIGAKFSDSFSIARQVVLPFLDSLPRAPIRTLVISHADNDHAGDATGFVRQLAKRQRPGFEVLSGEKDEIAIDSGLPCYQDYAVSKALLSENIELQFLWPPVPDYRSQSSNDLSCVLLIHMEGKQILFTGDIEKEVEYEMIRRGILPENIDVLIAPHHGSSTSSTHLFLNHLKPKHVIFSAGYKNRYHHPSQKVLARYRELGTHIWNTANHGALTIMIEAGDVVIKGERMENRRRWYLIDE